ncbi:MULTISPECIES: hypothetical protein [Staphylococcus]|uniref:hypothetical protein n=1 Tax=Staphylococcus TaxID=1279 RepID=UPI001072F909|nr:MULTISPECIES: hypothetical protein [Staphylococcus]MBF0814320.1 hypothetical protein [Staphylococcus saprophyticus]MDW8543363.1 hypothetical protein [Staphylococcus sp. KG4-1]MDW8562788.1 hypothetical protein [Staphylococcus sp. KG4-3]NQD99252.1 hypothetical protein [Staphylococcus xylosus]TFV22235.1 hypothetical protein E4T75_11515 [Staphylococcus saprophyticus]
MKQAIRYLAILVLSCMVLAACNSEEATQQSGEKAKATKSANQEKSSKASISDKDKKEIKKEVLSWLAKNEKNNDKAVSNRYFGSGSMSDGDWYAGTEGGEIQVSNKDKPGPKAFDLHTVTGAVTYTSNEGITGIDKASKNLSNIEGYSTVADINKPVTKYLFADNGKVYEYIFKDSKDVTLSSGFAPKDHNGKDPNLSPNQMFKVSDNKALNDFYSELLKKY